MGSRREALAGRETVAALVDVLDTLGARPAADFAAVLARAAAAE